jgi:hypothetical protein
MPPFAVIILTGSICGILDLISAYALFLSRGGSFTRLLQFIASGALGESSFRGGKTTAALGLLFHFVIGSQRRQFITRRAAAYHFLSRGQSSMEFSTAS